MAGGAHRLSGLGVRCVRGALFNVTHPDARRHPARRAGQSEIRRWGDIFLRVFSSEGRWARAVLAGSGTAGDDGDNGGDDSLLLDVLRLTYFADSLWHIGVLRFFVAMGVGGEWAVAAALVAEVVPPHARAHMSGFFHSTSIIGTFLAAWVGLFVGADWRMAFLVGVIPSLLVLWVRARVREPEKLQGRRRQSRRRCGEARQLSRPAPQSALESPGDPRAAARRRRSGSFWACPVAGQDLARTFRPPWTSAPPPRPQKSKVARQHPGARSRVGMLAFGPLAVRFGRRRTFVIYHAAGVVIVR